MCRGTNIMNRRFYLYGADAYAESKFASQSLFCANTSKCPSNGDPENGFNLDKTIRMGSRMKNQLLPS